MIGVDGSKTAELIDGSHILVSVDHHPINPKDPAGLEEFSYEN